MVGVRSVMVVLLQRHPYVPLVGLALVQGLRTCARGQLLLSHPFQVLPSQLGWSHTHHGGGGPSEAPQPVPEWHGLAVALPWVVVESQVLQGRQHRQALGSQLR